jgi:serine/threonine protein kinase
MEETLSILMYPVAECNLDTFLSRLHIGVNKIMRNSAIFDFFGCLANTVAYIHSSLTKHMDIKPQNILVRERERQGFSTQYKVYITDFGIARSYTSLDVSETEGPTMFTRRYAAPEVVDGQKRGLPADIFSLGCVFLEMAAVIVATHGTRQSLNDTLAHNEYGDTSYQANISSCRLFVGQELQDNRFTRRVGYWSKYDGWMDLCLIIPRMLDEDPAKRPSVFELIGLEALQGRECCSAGAEPLEAARSYAK